MRRSEQVKDLHTLQIAEFAFPTHLALSRPCSVLSYVMLCMFCVFRGSWCLLYAAEN